MRSLNSWLRHTLVGLFVLGWGPPLQAQSAPDLAVQCAVSLPSVLDFGTYRMGVGATLGSSLIIACTNRDPATRRVHLNLGSNLYVAGTLPELRQGGDRVRYDLYLGDTRTRLSAGAYQTTLDLPGSSTPAPLELLLLGRVEAGQWLSSGIYENTLEVTLEFDL